MICKKCGAKNREDRKKCFHCGNILITPQEINFEKRDEKYEDYPDDTLSFQKSYRDPKPSVITESLDVLPEEASTDSDEAVFPDVSNIVIEPIIRPEVIAKEKEDIPVVQPVDPSRLSVEPDDDTSIDDDISENNGDLSPDREDSYDAYDDELSEEDYEILKEIQAEKRLQERQKKEQAGEIKTVELDESTEQHFKSASSKHNTGIGFIIWILVLLFIVVALFMGVLIYNYINSDDGQSVDPTIDTTSELGIEPPVVTKLVDSNEKEYLHAVFKGTPGDRIYLECNNSYHTFIEETLEIDLYLEDLFSSEYEFRQDTVEANMHAYYVRGSKKYSCQSPYVKMTVPVAELDLSALPAQSIKVYSDVYNLRFWTANTATVELNGENITSAMSGTGSFNYEINVPENSNNTYYITVSQPYHLSRTEVFMIVRDLSPVTLIISTNNEESVTDNKITLRCQTEENTTLQANLPITSMEWNDLYSTADITLDLSECKYGEIEVRITATNSNGTSIKSHTFLYWPDEKTITTTASKFTSAVATNCTSYSNNNYVITSVKATKTSSSNRFEGTVNLNGVDYELIFDITDVKNNIIIGSNYKIFAQCTGTLEGNKPLFRVWFIYKG